MRRWNKGRAGKLGLPPGTLVHVGEVHAERVRIRLMDYDAGRAEEKDMAKAEDCFTYRDRPSITWINVDGLHEVEVLERLGTHFGVHALMLEDILNTGQRPKADFLGENLLLVLKMARWDAERDRVDLEQVSLVLGPRFVITFQEHEGDVFDPVRERIRRSTGRVRSLGADYLAYTLLDVIVDHYFVVIEKLGEQIEALEERVMKQPTAADVHLTHRCKTEMLTLRRAIWPLRELVNTLQNSEGPLMSESLRPYLRDVYDHCIQAMETLEAQRDVVSGLLDTYLTSIGNRTNEVMKVLTIIATLFIPLTFIVGVYGMNFEHMPELRWRWSYAAVWALMLLSAGAMLAYFRRKKWI